MWLILTFTVFTLNFSAVSTTTAQVEYRTAQECQYRAAQLDGAMVPMTAQFPLVTISRGESSMFDKQEIGPRVIGWRSTSATCV
jgi:hypothetical protein